MATVSRSKSAAPATGGAKSVGKSDDAVDTVHVALGERSYDIAIGRDLLASAGQRIRTHLGARAAAVVTDDNVAAVHLEPLLAGLSPGIQVRGHVSLPAGEASKSFGRLEDVCNRLLELGIERNDLVIALGGGVIGDLAGFAASILRRGVRFVQIPTSLLAQVDSSVGGKTGINTRHGKNLIGSFHQPSFVLIDTDVLTTLPSRELRAGYAEVVKYGILGDAAFFGWLEENGRSALDGNEAARRHIVRTCCAAKAAIVAADETETGDRALLNLGHTFGHALEAWAGYSDRLLHGEAVAIGMRLAAAFSECSGLAPAGVAQRISAHLQAADLPTRIAHVAGQGAPTRDELVRLMRQDKKMQSGRLAFILLRDIGEAFVARDVDMADIELFLDQELAAG